MKLSRDDAKVKKALAGNDLPPPTSSLPLSPSLSLSLPLSPLYIYI